MNRRERRAADPAVQAKKATHSSVLGQPGAPALAGGMQGAYGQEQRGGGSGWGLGERNPTPAGGFYPHANPFMQPKPAGLTLTSQTFPSNYYVEWNLSTWRYACDQAIKMGYAMGYATMASWAFECSPFIQSLFTALATPLDATKFYLVTDNGDILDDWSTELCEKPWQVQLRQEILFANFWGFTGLNFDPYTGKVYKYPMQDIDPINQMLKESTYSFYSGTPFAQVANTMFIQPSTNYERFLGYMQPITRSFIMMNMNKNSWIQAGRRLAFPLMTVGYPQDDGGLRTDKGQINPSNPYKLQAMDTIANADPSRGLAYPYVVDAKGNIVKMLNVEFEKTGTGAKAHDIFTDFNEAEKNEIREMILGGTLTADVGNSGSRALGEVQERKFDTMVASKIEYVLTVLNDQFLPKIAQYYSNFPKGARFDMNRAKPMTLADMQALSGVVTQNGKRLTTQFFVAQGIVEEFIEDAPEPIAAMPPEKPGKDANVKPKEKDFKMAPLEKAYFQARKKWFAA